MKYFLVLELGNKLKDNICLKCFNFFKDVHFCTKNADITKL